MDGDTGNGNAVASSELRKRLPERPEKPQQAKNADEARQVVVDLNTAEEKADKEDSEKRTFGRTADGTGMSLVHNLARFSTSDSLMGPASGSFIFLNIVC